jgi:phosphate transport system permease protein
MNRRLTRNLGNSLFLVFCWAATGLALLALAAILWSLLKQGIGGLDANVFTKSTPAPGSVGGLLNAILGSVMMCALAMLGAVVVGVLAGTWLSEYAKASRYGAVVRFLNDVLLSAPSILVGLFVYEIIVAPTKGFSGYAGAVALALLACPSSPAPPKTSFACNPWRCARPPSRWALPSGAPSSRWSGRRPRAAC